MNRNPILIRNISHLTDARYFAAMGVDWMSMVLNNDAKSFAMWHTLTEWIAGVKFAAEIATGDEMLLAKAIIDAKPDGIVSHQNIRDVIPPTTQLFLDMESSSGMEIVPNIFRIKSYNPNLSKEAVLIDDQGGIFLASAWSKSTLEDLLAKGYTGGICLFGGEEEGTGMRDYDLMDDLLGLLQ